MNRSITVSCLLTGLVSSMTILPSCASRRAGEEVYSSHNTVLVPRAAWSDERALLAAAAAVLTDDGYTVATLEPDTLHASKQSLSLLPEKSHELTLKVRPRDFGGRRDTLPTPYNALQVEFTAHVWFEPEIGKNPSWTGAQRASDETERVRGLVVQAIRAEQPTPDARRGD